MKIYPLTYQSAVILQANFMGLIGQSISKENFPNAIIKNVFIKEWKEDKFWVVYLLAHEKNYNIELSRQLVDYLIEEQPDFDFQKYGVTLHIGNESQKGLSED